MLNDCKVRFILDHTVTQRVQLVIDNQSFLASVRDLVDNDLFFNPIKLDQIFMCNVAKQGVLVNMAKEDLFPSIHLEL